jgi:hypothetical protein
MTVREKSLALPVTALSQCVYDPVGRLDISLRKGRDGKSAYWRKGDRIEKKEISTEPKRLPAVKRAGRRT